MVNDVVAQLGNRIEVAIAAQPPAVVHTHTSELDPAAVVDDVVAQLGYRLEAAIASQPPPIVRPQWNAEKVTETVSQTVKSAVTQLGARLEAAIASQSVAEPSALPPQLSATEIAETVGESVGRAVARLATRVEEAIASQPAPPPAPPAQWTASDLEEVATSLQHAVLQALNSYEQAALSPSSLEMIDAPATVRDVARVNQRIDELRALLLG
jgi:hypothetical protein